VPPKPLLWSRGVARWFRLSLSVADPFVCRCLTNSAMLPFPHPAHRTGRADLPHLVFSRPAQRLLTLRPARSPSRLATLCTRGFSSLVASTAALIATGWSEPVPGRVTPAVDHRLFTAHPVTRLTVQVGKHAWGIVVQSANWMLIETTPLTKKRCGKSSS
jgi:hypothetical protein